MSFVAYLAMKISPAMPKATASAL